MTRTFTQFAYGAARDLGCLRAGQTLSPDILADMLEAGNLMLDSWLIDELLVPCYPASVFNLTAGQQIYTIGPNEVAPNFAAARPTQINDANIILNTVTPALRTPLEIINEDEWADIRIQILPNALPLRLYYERSFSTTPTIGAARLLIWPGPLLAYQLELYTPDQVVLGAFPNTAAPFSYPPAYANLIRKNLAVACAPLLNMYCKAARMEGLMAPAPEMLELVTAQAAAAKAAVQSDNAPDPILTGDPAFRGGAARGGWNYLLGTTGRTGR